MRFPLRLQFFLIALLLGVVGFAALAWGGSRLVYEKTENETVRRLYRDANYLALSYKVNEGNINQSQMESVAYVTGSDIWIIGTDGTILQHSGTEEPEGLKKRFNPASGKGAYYMTGDFFGAFREEMLSVYAPLTMNITAEAYVVIHYPVSGIRSEADRQLGAAYIVFCGMLLLMALGFLMVDILMVRPLKKVQKAAREYADRNLTYPLTIRSRDEIRSLSDNLKEMARQMENTGDDQHRFLANISHDFRSPLTSIRGYMVAIQDGTIPPEMQGKYIDVVINETDRLTKLANGLLDMTQLENGIMLDRSEFDMNELIREVLPTFEGRVEEKNISFDITFDDEEARVYADRSRIEQVVYNLVDNAIKFSLQDSVIDISTHLHGDKIFVSVADHGVGIEKENLPKIWDRFYKTDTSRGRDKKGTGLGLSIVREIIQAHRENIDVISTPNIGTEFIFTLPAV